MTKKEKILNKQSCERVKS